MLQRLRKERRSPGRRRESFEHIKANGRDFVASGGLETAAPCRTRSFYGCTVFENALILLW